MPRMKKTTTGIAIVTSCIAATLAWAEPPEKEGKPMRDQTRMHQGHHAPLHAEMRAQMHAHDARLDELVAAMNAADGDAKVDAVAAVINELIAQRRTRRAHMEERWKGQQGAKKKASAKDDTP